MMDLKEVSVHFHINYLCSLVISVIETRQERWIIIGNLPTHYNFMIIFTEFHTKWMAEWYFPVEASLAVL